MTVLEHVDDIALTDIEASLRHLWQRCDQDRGTLNRSLTMNLIAVTDPDHEATMRDVVDQLPRRHPCRAFVVIVDKACSSIETTIAAQAQDRPGGREIVLEQITLRSSLDDFHKLAGVIRPLLVSDIPTHHYWATALPKRLDRLHILGDLADQVLLDSRLFDDPLVDLGRVQSVEHGVGEQDLRITDLTWFRVRPWRRALAEAFEQFSWDRSEPTEVRIATPQNPSAIAAGLHLSVWLRQRLAARIASTIIDEPAFATFEDLASLDLRFGESHVRISRTPADHRLEVEVTTPTRCLLPFHVPAENPTTCRLLANAMDAL